MKSLPSVQLIVEICYKNLLTKSLDGRDFPGFQILPVSLVFKDLEMEVQLFIMMPMNHGY